MAAVVFHAGHQIQLLQGGAEFFPALIHAIDCSRHEVRLETYIFSFDATGDQVAAALERAAQRGVSVYVVADGVGTSELPDPWRHRFGNAGVNWHHFSPLGRWGLLLPLGWRRLHRKLCVVDSAIAFCGGINILDDLFDPSYGVLESPRFDFAVRVTGPLVESAHGAMVQLWTRIQAKRQLEKLHFGDARQTWKHSSVLTHPPVPSAQPLLTTDRAGVDATLVLRDNVRNRNAIERAYRKAIAEARQEVVIASAYFLPGRKLRRALIHAARRGVRVCLLLQGRYEYFMQYHGARPVYGALLAAGVEIHEYSIGFLHAKVAVIDGYWVTVGSSNLDPLSLLLAREANVVIQDAGFGQELRRSLMSAMQTHGTQLNCADFANRPLRQRILDRLAFGTMRLILFLAGRRY